MDTITIQTTQERDTMKEQLLDVLKKYAVPDPSIVGKLPKGGITLDFVGHADITRQLIEIDPLWSWEPVAFDSDGLPAYRVENGMAHMAGRLTVHGVSRIGVGSVAHNKPDIVKELISDFLRNAAMRFGICLALWTKNEWEDLGGTPSKPAPTPVRSPQDADKPLSQDQIDKFNKTVVAAGLYPEDVIDRSGLQNGKLRQSDLPVLRSTFKAMRDEK
jgi:hypothetical protein